MTRETPVLSVMVLVHLDYLAPRGQKESAVREQQPLFQMLADTFL